MLKEKHVIDFFKGLTLPFCMFLMWHFRQYDNETLWIYTAIHGSYGILWCLKSYYFPDKQWEREVTVIKFIKLVLGLSGYWLAPFLIIQYKQNHPHHYLAVCTFIYAIGVFYHFAGDMQKYISLTLKPGFLINTGLWSNCRNPNYFGEFNIYVAFAALSGSWISAGVLASIIVVEWIPNMIKKDVSLSRYENFKIYKQKSGILIPKSFFIYIYLLTVIIFFFLHYSNKNVALQVS